MIDFLKRNLVWGAIFLCIIGVALAIVGIPTHNVIFFFVGIILSLPTIAYLVYQVFFDKGAPEIEVSISGAKFATGDVTSIITEQENLLLKNQSQIAEEDDLEPFYNGYASNDEIEQRLYEVTEAAHETALNNTPAEIIPEPQTDEEILDNADVQAAVQSELLRQREIQNLNATPISFEPEIIPVPEKDVMTNQPEISDVENNATPEADTIPETISDPYQVDENLPYEPVSLTAPTDVYDPTTANPVVFTMSEPKTKSKTTTPAPVTAQLQEGDMIIHINPATAKIKKQKALEKKALLSQENLERYLEHYFIETAACFLADRNLYKDRYGIAPYNKFTTNSDTGLPEYTMSATKGRLYKFCTYLIDAERFITHPVLFNDFINAIERGVSLSRISETLHPMYRKKFKKDFVLNLSNREDWDNVIILVYNNYILNNDNFKDVFFRVPFAIPSAYNEQNLVNYLKNADVQDRFSDRYPALTELGIPTIWDAIFICFVNSIKAKLPTEFLENAILKDYKKIARALKREDNLRRRLLKKKAS